MRPYNIYCIKCKMKIFDFFCHKFEGYFMGYCFYCNIKFIGGTNKGYVRNFKRRALSPNSYHFPGENENTLFGAEMISRNELRRQAICH